MFSSHNPDQPIQPNHNIGRIEGLNFIDAQFYASPPPSLDDALMSITAAFADRAREVVLIKGRGYNNLVFQIVSFDEKISYLRAKYVIGDTNAIERGFRKEAFCVDLALSLGIPVAPHLPPVPLKIPCLTSGGTYVCSLQPELPGIMAIRLPDQVRRSINWRSAGTVLRAIHRIAPVGWGQEFISSRFGFDSWSETADKLIEQGLIQIDRLTRESVISKTFGNLIAKRVAGLLCQYSNQELTTLNHGDYHNANLLGDSDTGQITGVLDWENACSMPGSEFDFAHTTRWLFREGPVREGWFSNEDFHDLLDGYGITISAFRQRCHYRTETLQLLDILKYLDMFISRPVFREDLIAASIYKLEIIINEKDWYR